MRQRYLLWVGIAAILVLLRAELSQAGSTPAGQPTLANVTSLAALKAEFNRDAASLRAIILVSPSCPYCLKGVSEIERILGKHPQLPIVVFVVWEPILPTDWGKPGTGALHRLSDARVRQFWDAGHRVAEALEISSHGRDLQPDCCFHNGIWWDLMAALPSGGQWGGTLPEPVLLGGTVEDVAPAFDALLTK